MERQKWKAENAVKTTIRDIANQLGVSASTVSKVINGKGSISPELRQKVLAVVEAANYQPNLNAKSLRTRTTNTIGVILPDITNLFYCYLMKGIEAKCQEENFSVLVGTCNFNYQREKEYFDLFRSKNVTGVIIASLGDMDLGEDGYDAIHIDGHNLIGQGWIAITTENVDDFGF